MARKRIGDLADAGIETIAIWGAIGFGAYYVITNVLPNVLGTGNDSVVSAQQAVPAVQNPFSYQFQPFIDFYNNNPVTGIAPGGGSNFWSSLFGAGASDSSNAVELTIQQFFVSLKASPPTSSPWSLVDVVDLSKRSEALNSAINGFTLTATDQNAAMSPLTGLRSQLDCAFIANYFWWNFNQDLVTDLQGSIFKQGLSPSNIDMLIKNVNALPVTPNV